MRRQVCALWRVADADVVSPGVVVARLELEVPPGGRQARQDPAEELATLEELFGAGNPGPAQVARFREWMLLRPSGAGRCPRVAAGKRCELAAGGRDCVCSRLHRLLDHPRMWLDAAGERVYTAEPYHFDGEELAELVAECRPLGLYVTVHGTSPYFPGRTVLVLIRREAG